MKSIHIYLLMILITIGYSDSFAQPDTLYFDPASGNYIIEYQGYFPFARGPGGVLRSLTRDDTLRQGEVYVEVDSMLTVTFEPATKVNPKVNGVVSKTAQQDTFLYSYSIENSIGSQQNLRTFILEFGVDEVTDASTMWSSNRIRAVKNGQIGFANRWAWHGDQGLEPTWSTEGFALKSPGLPGITNAYFRGRAPNSIRWPGGLPGGALRKQVSALRVYPANYVLRKTVAPVALPTPFEGIGFLDTLSSYTSQSLVLGWIANQATADKYESHFSTAQTQLQQQDTTAARSELQTVLQEVDQDSSTVLTGEAYALLRFNTEYLLDQLPVTVITVTVDIKPGSYPNSINVKSKGVIPVAVLTDPNFDATTVDVSTLVFGPAGAQPKHNGHIEDVDGDGDDDLMLHFNTQDTGIQCGETEATLSGATLGGQAIKGSDSINTVGCK